MAYLKRKFSPKITSTAWNFFFMYLDCFEPYKQFENEVSIYEIIFEVISDFDSRKVSKVEHPEK